MKVKTFRIVLPILGFLVFGMHEHAISVHAQAASTATRQKIDWFYNPSEHRGKNGQRLTFVCPSYGVAYLLYGTDVYTDDSSVCTAAAHAGLITVDRGGAVIVEIRPGQSSYDARQRNGVGSLPYRSFPGSFIVEAAPQEISWSQSVTEYRGRNGQRLMLACPANGSARTIYGSDVYTDDSPVCPAAVHAGLITFENGGSVTLEIRPGENAYAATTRNGVTSTSYGAWRGSFVFVR